MKPTLLILSVLCVTTLNVRAQGTFQNLNFEMGTIVPVGGEVDPFIVSASDALPGWTLYLNGAPTTFLIYNTLPLSGFPTLSIHDSTSPVLPPFGTGYFVAMRAIGATAGIGQTAQVPANALSLRFWAADYQNFEVTFNGGVIPLVEVGTGPGYSILGGDISRYAGQTGELRFTHSIGLACLDNIQFSIVPVPEPSGWILVLGGLAGLGLVRYLHRAKGCINDGPPPA